MNVAATWKTKILSRVTLIIECTEDHPASGRFGKIARLNRLRLVLKILRFSGSLGKIIEQIERR